MLKKPLWSAALASGAVLVTSSLAVASSVLISGPSPYAACASNDNNLTGRTFMNAEVEPQVAVQGSKAIAMFHQDRKSNGGAHGIGVGYSTDGGASWTELDSTGLPLTACSPNVQPALSNMWRASDPWVSFGPDGIAYASALSFNISVPNNANAVVAARSTDGGKTWDHITPISGVLNAQNSTDKNSTTADPTKNKTAYTVWDTLTTPTDNPDDNPHTASYTGPAYFSKTTDGGKTWSAPQIILSTATRQQTIGNIIVVDPRNDTLYNFTDLILPPNTLFQGKHTNEQVAFVKSTDGGATWTRPQIIAPFNSVGVHNPNTGQPARVGDGLEEVAIDPSNGKLYVVWESSSMFGKSTNQLEWDDQIVMATSADGGATWTKPAVIHRLANDMPTFTPTVAVNGGRVAVTYYDSRNLQPGQTANWPTDYFVAYSTDGGNTFVEQAPITNRSFDLSTAPVARGFFLGDYEALQPSGSGFLAVFVKTNCDAPYPASNPFCAAASSNTAPTSNTNADDVFAASLP